VFDPKSEAHEFVGADRAEAVASACRFYGLEESELTIVEPAAESVSGLSARALVVAAPPASQRAPRGRDGGDRDRSGRERSDRDRGRGDRDRGERDRGRDRDRGDRGRRERDRGGRGRDRDRGERGGSNRGDRNERGGSNRGDRDRGRDREGPPAAPSVDEPSEAEVDGELGTLGEFVKGVVERMKLGRFGISESSEEGLTVIQLTGNAAMGLSTAETRVGDAIQLLANQVAIKGGKDGPRVVVDVEGDRTRREAYLEQLARRAADRASSSGDSVALDPMNGKDRRAIHVALREEDGVATLSVGEGQYRQVVVVPEGAEDYEEALRKSEEAARSEEG